jgi:SAM-dependent methyltransferase
MPGFSFVLPGREGPRTLHCALESDPASRPPGALNIADVLHLAEADYRRGAVPPGLPSFRLRPAAHADASERSNFVQFLKFIKSGVAGVSQPKMGRVKAGVSGRDESVRVYLLPPEQAAADIDEGTALECLHELKNPPPSPPPMEHRPSSPTYDDAGGGGGYAPSSPIYDGAGGAGAGFRDEGGAVAATNYAPSSPVYDPGAGGASAGAAELGTVVAGTAQETGAKHYNTLVRDKNSRHKCLIFHLRAMNNWVKTTLFRNWFCPAEGHSEIAVLELACGKGGDLFKWQKMGGVYSYVGVDIARNSLDDAVARIRSLRNQSASFTVKFIHADLGRQNMCKDAGLHYWTPSEFGDPWKESREGAPALRPGARFDIASMQFAVHYMFQEETRCNTFFGMVAGLLRPGARFLATTPDADVLVQLLIKAQAGAAKGRPNTLVQIKDNGHTPPRIACEMRFAEETARRLVQCKDPDDEGWGLEYKFKLIDGNDQNSVDNVPEWLVPIPLIECVAKRHGLKLILRQNFQSFFTQHRDWKENGHSSAFSEENNVFNRKGTISNVEWEVARLYTVLAFEKEADAEAAPAGEAGLRGTPASGDEGVQGVEEEVVEEEVVEEEVVEEEVVEEEVVEEEVVEDEGLPEVGQPGVLGGAAAASAADEQVMLEALLASKEQLRKELGEQWDRASKGTRRVLTNKKRERDSMSGAAHVQAKRQREGLRLAIIVPYRDQPLQNRQLQLQRFLEYMPQYLAQIRTLESFVIVIVEQTNDDQLFNRGKLLNIGFEMYRHDCNAFVMHDVDMLPSESLLPWYSCLPRCPLHTAWVHEDVSGYGAPYPHYVGGIIAMTAQHMDLTNGFPNNFWGWGGEDDELRRRFEKVGLEVLRPMTGSIIDTENELINTKGGERASARGSQFKCMMKHERNFEHGLTWKTNGLSNLLHGDTFEVLKRETFKEYTNCFKLTVDLKHSKEEDEVIAQIKRDKGAFKLPDGTLWKEPKPTIRCWLASSPMDVPRKWHPCTVGTPGVQKEQSCSWMMDLDQHLKPTTT